MSIDNFSFRLITAISLIHLVIYLSSASHESLTLFLSILSARLVRIVVSFSSLHLSLFLILIPLPVPIFLLIMFPLRHFLCVRHSVPRASLYLPASFRSYHRLSLSLVALIKPLCSSCALPPYPTLYFCPSDAPFPKLYSTFFFAEAYIFQCTFTTSLFTSLQVLSHLPPSCTLGLFFTS